MREALRRALRERRLRRRAAARGAELVPLTPRTPDFLRGGDAPVVVAVTRDEALRLPFFLSYYRSLGCAGFVVADNESTDGSRELLRGRVGGE